jgi:hypothetical protein
MDFEEKKDSNYDVDNIINLVQQQYNIGWGDYR